MHYYYVMLDCENCDEPIASGLHASTITHNNELAVDALVANEIQWRCDTCGAAYATNTEVLTMEEGRDPDDEEDDDDEAA